MKRLQKIREEKDAEFMIFFLFLVGMALYYGWRLFALIPWYDELYTYYYFVSRGPIYAAIHWPLPNNHMGYSVLSAILDLFGNAAVGLRGVSWICSLVSLCLLFAIGRKCFRKGLALVPVFLFASMELVNILAVQGRGYALAACLYLTALYELMEIVVFDRHQKRNYVIFACALIWALYTLPSSVYFVLPLCLVGGSFLLLEKRKKDFFAIFVTSLISAACTVALYALVWLAIGSNLLSKSPDSSFYGQGHGSIILHAPFQAIGTGINYMLDTPYIQSVPRAGYLSRFWSWIKVLFENYYRGFSIPLLVVTGIGLLLLLIRVFQKIRKSKKTSIWEEGKIAADSGFLEWYLLLSFVFTPLMLIIQAALPYYRVFSFFGIPFALLITWLLDQLLKWSKRYENKRYERKRLANILTAMIGIIAILILVMPSSHEQYSMRESAIAEAYRAVDVTRYEKICVADCDQEYLLKYMYGLDMKNDIDVRLTTLVEGADCVLLDKDLLLSDEDYLAKNSNGDEWKFYVTKDTLPLEYLEANMQMVYENDRFVFFVIGNNMSTVDDRQ